MASLRTFASLWTLADRRELSVAEKCRLVREAGFDGVHWDPFPELEAPLREYELPFWGAMILDASSDLEASIDAQARLGACRVNVQYGAPDDEPERAAERVLELVRLGAERGIAVALETHRGRANDTPERHRRLAARFRELSGAPLEITPDLSHPAVVLHLAPERWPELIDDEVLAARGMHLRPFNGHHAQVPVTDGAGGLAPELDDWLGFVRVLFERWRGRNGAEELWVCPELGPRVGGYGLSCFPDSWSDAVTLRGLLEELWDRAL